MKLLHLGDLHLGKSLGDFPLEDDQRYILNQILEIADREGADGVLIAGDVYDRAIPSETAVGLLDWFLDALARRNIQTFMISGNHDSDDRLNYAGSFFAARGVHISSVFDGTLHRHTLTDAFGEVDIYLLPFVKASQVRHFFPDAEIDNYDDAVRTVIESAHVDPARRNVIVAHQFVTGTSEDAGARTPEEDAAHCTTEEAGAPRDPEMGGSESIGTRSVGLVEKIGYDCFDAFDYAALGHIHSGQRVGRDAVRYSGSPLKYSLSEAAGTKSVPLITLEEKGSVRIELVPLKPMRDVRHLRGPLEELLREKPMKGKDDFIYATLTDEDMKDNVMGIFQQTYPNTVKVDYDNAHTRAVEHVDIAGIAENRSFADLIGEFYRLMYNTDISEEEMNIMRMAAREAGAIDEAD